VCLEIFRRRNKWIEMNRFNQNITLTNEIFAQGGITIKGIKINTFVYRNLWCSKFLDLDFSA
jgi:hypothetical protein